MIPQQPPSDIDLVRAAQKGDQRAYGTLVCRHRQGVVLVVYRMCGDMALADEAAQEAFIRAWQHLAGYQSQHAFRSWIYRIAVNAALDVLRKQRRLTSLDGGPDGEDSEGIQWPSGEPGPEEMVEQRQGRAAVQQAVLSLPEGYRAALVLREYGGLSYAEIASVLGIPLGTVMSRLNAARRQLRAALVEQMEVV